MKLLNFLFGKKPGIFNKTGRVEHQLEEHSWSEWKNRYAEGIEYDWKSHSGTKYTPSSAFPSKPKAPSSS